MRNAQQLTLINILNDTLRKKEECLKKLQEQTVLQSELMEEEDFDVDRFNETITAKQTELDALDRLDEGFMELYARVEKVMKENTSDYAEEISEAQALIKRQMELSIELQALEDRNKNRLSLVLSRGRQKVKAFKQNTKTAAAYYKNMANRHQEGDSYFLDQKK